MLWDRRSWKEEVLETGSYTLTCKFESVFQDFNCHITGVYALNGRVEREHVWEEIGVVRSVFEGPWAVCGYFNIIRYPSEKRNCKRRTLDIIEFSDLIEDMDMVYLQLVGGNYTWFKGGNNNVASRIDKILISKEWDANFSRI